VSSSYREGRAYGPDRREERIRSLEAWRRERCFSLKLLDADRAICLTCGVRRLIRSRRITSDRLGPGGKLIVRIEPRIINCCQPALTRFQAPTVGAVGSKSG
jgi:hypothetical protein